MTICFVASCQSGPAWGNAGDLILKSKKSVDSILMESVDAETGGKRSGGTHFPVNGDTVFLDYEYFDDQKTAESKVDEVEYPIKRVIAKEDLRNANGEPLGKLLFVELDSKYFNKQFCLSWSNRNKFTQVCSEFEKAIVNFRNTYEL